MTPSELRRIRTDVLGWSQRRLAGELGLTLAGYQGIESGKVNADHVDRRTELAIMRLVDLDNIERRQNRT